MMPKVSPKQFLKDLKSEIKEDNVATGAAALAFYLMLAIFPAMIALLSLIPYLPVANLEEAVMDFLRQAMPGEAAELFTGTVQSIVGDRRGGLLTFGLLFTIWSAASGLFAIMQQLNVTYDVRESRSFLELRGTAVMLTVLFGALLLGAFSLIVFGGVAQGWLADQLGWSAWLTGLFAALRWIIIAAALLLAFALTYYFGPDVEQEFRFITPGSVLGVVLLAAGAAAFTFYVANFANYSKVYGSLGAVIILLMWLYLTGWVILLGSEINALVEYYSAAGKRKGEKQESGRAGAPLHPRPQPS